MGTKKLTSVTLETKTDKKRVNLIAEYNGILRRVPVQELTENEEQKVPLNQGAAYAGFFLGINDAGMVEAMEVPTGGDGSQSGGTGNYNALSNKPSINGIPLVGNKSTQELFGDIGIIGKNITIPVDGWKEDTDGLYPFCCDFQDEEITANMIPMLTVLPVSMETALICGFATCAQTFSGALRVYAETVPSEPIQTSLALLGISSAVNGGTSAESGNYITMEQLNAAVDNATNSLLDDKIATEDEVNEMFDEVFTS